MITLTTPELISSTKDRMNLPTDKELEDLPCGLFRCNLVEDAGKHLPELRYLFIEAENMLFGEGHDSNDWVIDVKIHMLMEKMYPCIPNWHCDNVLRNKDGKLDYIKTSELKDKKPMYLWVSGTPCTEFLREPLEINDKYSFGMWGFAKQSLERFNHSHDTVSSEIQNSSAKTNVIEPQCWYKFDQLTPHRGMVSKKKQWRIFVRLTHKSVTPAREGNVLRRHSQVYLDSNNFSW